MDFDFDDDEEDDHQDYDANYFDNGEGDDDSGGEGEGELTREIEADKQTRADEDTTTRLWPDLYIWISDHVFGLLLRLHFAFCSCCS